MFQILNVRYSRLDRGSSQSLGTLLERRLGPVAWTSHTTDPDTRYVTATGHFPPSLWRPRIDEEAFSRVVLQWQCAWLGCRWAYIDPDAWSRVLPVPCRDGGPRRCAAEAFDYIATGAVTVTAPGTPRRTAP